MKEFLVLLFLGLACSDKLDLTYLPPPGSQYAGGRPEDIQTPLEFPKQSYSTTRRPDISGFRQENLRPEDTKATIGINRVPSQIQNQFETPGPNEPFTNIQNTHGLPTTTVSYAFTQTTTHPPSQAFETTISPITGLPNAHHFNIPSQEANQGINQYYPNIPGGVNLGNNVGNQQPVNIVGRPTTSGFQRVVDEYGNQQPTFSTTPSTITKFPDSPAHFQTPEGEIFVDQFHPGHTQFESDQQTVLGFVPQVPHRQISGNKTLFGGSTTQPEFISSTSQPGIVSSFPGTTYEESVSQIFPSSRPGAQAGSEGQPGIYGPDAGVTPQGKPQIIGGFSPQPQTSQHQFQSTTPQVTQRHPGLNVDVKASIDESKDIYKPYQPFSSVTPTSSSQGIFNKQNGFESSRPGYNVPAKQGNTDQIVYRPERPQAESDRNAVILNYDNVITPDGFAYSFDTSNGIHADESGTATDGVKAEGSFSYIGDDGKVYSIVYTADENGYQPHGDHLPTPPPIPEAIQRVIEKVKQEKEAGIIHDGSYDEDKYGYKKYEDDQYYNPQDTDDRVNLRKESQNNVPSRQQFESKRPIGGSKTRYNDGNLPHREETKGNKFIDDKIREQPTQDVTLRPNTRVTDRDNINSGLDSRPKGDSGRKEVHIKGTTSRPIYEQGDESDKILGSVDDVIKTHNGPSRRPITDLGEYEDDAGHLTISDGLIHPTSARPSNQVFVDKDGFVHRKEYDRKDGKPATTVRPKYSGTGANVDYDSEDYKTTSQLPLRKRPGGIKEPPHTIEQTISKGRRPLRPGLRVTQDEGNKDYIDVSFGLKNDNENDEGSGSGSGAMPVYDDTEDSDYDEYKTHRGQHTSTTPPRIFSTKYAASRDKVQIPDDIYIENGEIDSSVQPDYGQIVSSLPTFPPRISTANKIETIKQRANETGYQYIPPLSKFEEVNTFPGRVSTTRIPQQTTYFGNKGSTTKPLINPNDSRVTYSPEGVYDGDKVISGFPSKVESGSDVSINDGKRGPTHSQTYYDDVASTTRPSSKPFTSTYGPVYQTTRRPSTLHYSNQYSQTPGYTITPEGTLIPSQPGDDAYYQEKEFSTRKPYNRVSSTTPIPSRQPAYYGTSQKDAVEPGQQMYYTEGTRKPGSIFASTTPLTPHSAFDGTYSPGITPGHSTSFRTSEPVNPTNDYSADIAASRLPTAGPTKSSVTFVDNTKYGDRLPSTTYRPNYTIVSKEEITSGRPGVVVDRYGRPIVAVEPDDYDLQFSSGGAKNVPVDNIRRPTQYRPSDGFNRSQTSTERVIGEDFSGPKQQQKFDPETGYYY